MLAPQVPTAAEDGEDDQQVEDQRGVEQGEEMLPLLPMSDSLAEVLVLPQQVLDVGRRPDAGVPQGGLDVGDAPRRLPRGNSEESQNG